MESTNVTPGPCCARRGLFRLFSCSNEGLYPCFNCERGVCDDHATQFGDGKILCPRCLAEENENNSQTAVAGGTTAFGATDHNSVSTPRTPGNRDSAPSSFRDS